MPATPSFPPLPVRRGVTLLELLVVLVLMGIAAVVVAPALSRPVLPPASGGTDAVAELVASARRAAIRRGEPVRLRLAPDGVWALVADRNGAVIASGRVPAGRPDDAETVDVRIDAMGSCTPAGALNARLQRTERAFDPLACSTSPRSP